MHNEIKEEDIPQKSMNPWLHIWTNPRETVRSAITSRSIGLAVLIAALAGIQSALNEATGTVEGDGLIALVRQASLSEILLIVIFVGAIIGLVSWVITAGAVTVVGKWFGGKGKYMEVLIAMGLALIPMVFGLVFQIVNLMILGPDELFHWIPSTDGESVSFLILVWLLLYVTISVVVAGWSIIITLKAIGEAHQFSAWKALGVALTIAAIVVVIVVVVLIGLMMLFMV